MSINFHIKTKEHDLTPAMTELVHEKLGVIEKYVDTSGDHEVLAEVELGRRSNHHNKGDVYRAEVNLSYRGNVYRAVAKRSDAAEALDVLKDEITKQLRRNKGRRENLFVRGARQIKRMLRGR